MLRKIKQEPNPRESENFFFVNALNEWGEGNNFEPSVHFGYRYAQATKDALLFSKEPDVWRDEEFQKSLKRMQNPLLLQDVTQLDICVFVRTGSQHGDDCIFTLDATLRSLQAQNNRNWKALVFEEKGDNWDSLKPMIMRLFDPRIIEADIAKTISVGDKAWETKETNGMLGWLMRNLELFDRNCAGARYLLTTDGGNEYKPTAFDALPTSSTDLFGLNSESAWTSWDEERLRNGADHSHENDCLRLEDVSGSVPKIHPSEHTNSSSYQANHDPLQTLNASTSRFRPRSNIHLSPSLSCIWTDDLLSASKFKRQRRRRASS